MLGKKKNIQISRKIKLDIKTYKLKADQDYKEGFDPLTEFTDDLLTKVETRELEGPWKIVELSKEIADYNKRQVKIATQFERGTINQRRIVKHK